MNNLFWIGVFPGISTEMLKYVITKIDEFMNLKIRKTRFKQKIKVDI